jgi:excisionase family DNA binding protein
MGWYMLGPIMKDWKSMMDTWLTVKEVAQYLKLSPDLIYKLAQQAKIPASKVGTAWRFKKQKIDQWMEANENRYRR